MGIMKWDSHDESLEASVGRMNLRKMDCNFSQGQVQYLLRRGETPLRKFIIIIIVRSWNNQQGRES
jgi:hypothetical protein